jgi:hypothetical protein
LAPPEGLHDIKLFFSGAGTEARARRGKRVVEFAMDSPVEGTGFELQVPRQMGNVVTGAAPSSGASRAMRKVARLAVRRQRGLAQRSHSTGQLA